MTTPPVCDVCGDRIRETAHYIGGRLLCSACWRWIARARGKRPPEHQTPHQRELAQRQLSFSEVPR